MVCMEIFWELNTNISYLVNAMDVKSLQFSLVVNEKAACMAEWFNVLHIDCSPCGTVILNFPQLSKFGPSLNVTFSVILRVTHDELVSRDGTRSTPAGSTSGLAWSLYKYVALWMTVCGPSCNCETPWYYS